jgi:tetratricopeptide (TPR) repeat protein
MSPDQRRSFEQAEDRLRAGKPAEAQAILRLLIRQIPDRPQVWWAYANSCRLLGDADGAETALRRVTTLDAGRPTAWAALGDLLAAQDRGAEAEAAWRAAVAADPRHPAAVALAEHLGSTGRPGDGLAVLAPLADGVPQPAVLLARARQYRGLDRFEEAAADLRAAAALAPGVATIDYELAVTLGNLSKGAETAEAGRRALKAGMRSPQVTQVIGHGERISGELDLAEATFREGLKSWPDHQGLHRELANLVWARTGDTVAATAELDRALARRPLDASLLVLKARLLYFAGATEAALATLAPATARADAPPALLNAASRLTASSNPEAAVALAHRALMAEPNDPFGLAVMAEAQLAAGDYRAASEAVDRLLEIAPRDAHGQSLRRIVWRMIGDPRYGEAFDYGAMVSTQAIETPVGWPSLEAYLTDLATALRGLHASEAHPVGQSLRGGTQTDKSLAESDDPAIRAFFQVIEAPIRAHVAWLDAQAGKAEPTPFKLARSWSVRLRPGGNHVDHLHNAWISSAFYVVLPPSVEAGGKSGWLRFGRPGIPTRPDLPAEHWVKPRPGLLALFPSYMWHGTEPFEDDAERLTIAFDVERA